MKEITPGKMKGFWVLAILLLMPAVLYGQAQGQPKPPSIAAPLIREGDLAVHLFSVLGMGQTTDESWAESKLGEIGISPRNGWIAGYPVTPDVLEELRKSVGDAADKGSLSMSRDDALNRLESVVAGTGISATPYGGTGAYGSPDTAAYIDPATLNNYYAVEGPPIYTYYAPPLAYYDLYGFVPYPLWYSGFWFPGFYVLRDFHRSFFAGGRVVFCSNHFHDYRSGRFARVDPVGRFHGTPFAGSSYSHGVPISRGAVSGYGRTTANTQFRAGPAVGAEPTRHSGVTGSPYYGVQHAGTTYRTSIPTGMNYRGSSVGYPTSHSGRPTSASYRTSASVSPSYHSNGFTGSSFHHGGGGFTRGGIGGRSSGSGGFSGRSPGGGHSFGGGRGHR
jgi:hypothetical protein